VLRLRCKPETQRILRETAPGFIRDCCEGAARRAGVGLDDIALFVFNTPTAWFAAVCVRALGITADRTVNTYPAYANVGPALLPVNLHHAATEGRIRRGDLVLAFTIGSVSTAAATVMRWGDVALGPVVTRSPATARAVGE
jgi:3-oxoacyl-[acyl-carrier-protein] synthase-3